MLRKIFRLTLVIAALTAPNLSCGAHRPGDGAEKPLFAQSTVFASRGVVSAANYRRDTLIPAGSRVEIRDADGDEIRFRVVSTGMEYVFVNHRATGLTIEAAFAEMFGPQDPTPKIDALPKEQRDAILAGKPLAGMTKEIALLALGQPPHNETPSTEADVWTYWSSRVHKMSVYFENGVIASGPPAPAPAPAAAPAPAKVVLYARCNVHFEENTVRWPNYLRGPVLKFNTPIEVLDRGRSAVRFRAVDSGTEYKFENDEGKSGQATWTMFQRLFGESDQASRLDALSAADKGHVAGAEVVLGMSKSAVEMALCPPPPHETPSLDSSNWTYWTSVVNRKRVVFDTNGIVAQIQQ